MAAEKAEVLSDYPRRGSFSITTASEIMNNDGQINCDINSAMNDELSVINDKCCKTNDTTSVNPNQNNVTQLAIGNKSKFKVNATPFFIPKDQLPIPAKMASMEVSKT